MDWSMDWTHSTFDIAYPKPLYSLLLFIQRFVLNIRDSQPVPNIVTVLVTALSKSQLDYIVVLDYTLCCYTYI